MPQAGIPQRPRRPVVGAAATGGPPLLYVDALNFMGHFFDGSILERRAPGVRRPKSTVDIWRDVAGCRENVGVFMREARAAGWQVTVFLDMVRRRARVRVHRRARARAWCPERPGRGQVKDRDDEVRTWWKRKAASMLEGGTSLIPFTIILLGHFFEAEGARVRYAAATDNDPTLAAYANIYICIYVCLCVCVCECVCVCVCV